MADLRQKARCYATDLTSSTVFTLSVLPRQMAGLKTEDDCWINTWEPTTSALMLFSPPKATSVLEQRKSVIQRPSHDEADRHDPKTNSAGPMQAATPVRPRPSRKLHRSSLYLVPFCPQDVFLTRERLTKGQDDFPLYIPEQFYGSTRRTFYS